MFELFDNEQEKKYPLDAVVQYKMLSKNDEDVQCLFRIAKSVNINKKGIEILLKEEIEEKTIVLLKIHIKGEEKEIKASAIVTKCEKTEKEKVYKAELDFIIIKSIDLRIIDDYIKNKMLKVHR